MRSVALTRQALPFALALLAGAALLVPAPSRGVTLGNIAFQSGLGQPLRVVIPVALSGNEVLNAECMKLVADDSSSVPQIVAGRIVLEREPTHPRLVITTAKPVTEPAIRLAVQVGCGSTSRRDYTVLLDPPALGSSMAIASNDTDEPAWVAMQERPSWQRRSDRRSSPDPQPSAVSRLSSWGSPVATGSTPPTQSLSQPPSPTLVDAKSVAPVAASGSLQPITRREPADLGRGSSSFIPEAAAAPLQPRSVASLPQPTSSRPIPIAFREQPQLSPSLTTAQMNWQYAIAGAGVLFLGVGAFIVRRRTVLAANWFFKADRMTLKGETQAEFPTATLADFDEMSGPVSTKARSWFLPDEAPADQTTALGELDTLLHDIKSDEVNEQTVKDAWKEAATEAATDVGTDSILKAIAAAERDLQIGTESAQFVMDTDELTVPNPLAKPKSPAKQG